VTAAMARTCGFWEHLIAWENGAARDLRDQCGVTATSCASPDSRPSTLQHSQHSSVGFACGQYFSATLFIFFEFIVLANRKSRITILENGDKGSFQAGKWPEVTSCVGKCRNLLTVYTAHSRVPKHSKESTPFYYCPSI
jgi:hypothetical protein